MALIKRKPKTGGPLVGSECYPCSEVGCLSGPTDEFLQKGWTYHPNVHYVYTRSEAERDYYIRHQDRTGECVNYYWPGYEDPGPRNHIYADAVSCCPQCISLASNRTYSHLKQPDWIMVWIPRIEVEDHTVTKDCTRSSCERCSVGKYCCVRVPSILELPSKLPHKLPPQSSSHHASHSSSYRTSYQY